MKKTLLLTLLLVNRLFAQDSLLTEKAYLKEMESVRMREMQSFQRLSPNGPAGTNGFTLASDNFDVHHVRGEWNIDPSILYISGKVTFDFTMVQSSSSITFDLLNQLVVDSVWYHGSKITFQRLPNDGLVINFPAAINTGTKDSVSIFYQGVPGGSGFGSFYKGTHSGVPVIWTLSEPYGAREWWPCKNNLKDKFDSLDVYVTCDQQYQPSSNGLLIENSVNGSQRTSHFRHRFPIATYLVAIAVSNYNVYTDTAMVGNSVINIQNFYYPEIGSASFYTSYHRSAFRTFSKWFGLYPFAAEKYGHTQWGWNGGMEHQTNSFVNAPTPNLSAHELAHQWFGDYVTTGSWQHIWLNEGFATYLTLMFLEFGYPNSYGPTFSQTFYSASMDSSGSVYVPDTSDVSRIFSNKLSYNKGAMVLHMLRKIVGDSAFARGVRRYLADPAVKFGFAFTDDLKRNMELESGRNLNTFFQKWIYGEGTPHYKAEWSQNSNNWVNVKLLQSTTHPSVTFFDMPVTLLLRGASQGKSYKVEHYYNGQEFSFDPGFAVDTVIIDPNYEILSLIRTSVKKNSSTVANEVKVYPNPSPGQLYISLNNPTDKKLYLRLFNTLGQLVWQKDMDTPGNNEIITIPATMLAKGTYLLHIRSEKSIKMVRKIIR